MSSPQTVSHAQKATVWEAFMTRKRKGRSQKEEGEEPGGIKKAKGRVSKDTRKANYQQFDPMDRARRPPSWTSGCGRRALSSSLSLFFKTPFFCTYSRQEAETSQISLSSLSLHFHILSHLDRYIPPLLLLPSLSPSSHTDTRSLGHILQVKQISKLPRRWL